MYVVHLHCVCIYISLFDSARMQMGRKPNESIIAIVEFQKIIGLCGFLSLHIYYAISEALVLITNLMINKCKHSRDTNRRRAMASYRLPDRKKKLARIQRKQ